MAGFPGLKFAGQIFPSRRSQFGDDARMPRGEPILKLVECFYRGENRGWDFNGFRFHNGTLSNFALKDKIYQFHKRGRPDIGILRK